MSTEKLENLTLTDLQKKLAEEQSKKNDSEKRKVEITEALETFEQNNLKVLEKARNILIAHRINTQQAQSSNLVNEQKFIDELSTQLAQQVHGIAISSIGSFKSLLEEIHVIVSGENDFSRSAINACIKKKNSTLDFPWLLNKLGEKENDYGFWSGFHKDRKALLKAAIEVKLTQLREFATLERCKSELAENYGKTDKAGLEEELANLNTTISLMNIPYINSLESQIAKRLAKIKEEEDEARRLKEEETQRLQKEEEARRLKEEETQRLQKEEEARRLKEEETQRLQKEEEARRLKEEETQRLQKEEETRRLKEEETQRLQKEEEARRLKEEETQRLQKEQEAKRLQKKETKRLQKEQEAKRLQEEEIKRLQKEQETKRLQEEEEAKGEQDKATAKPQKQEQNIKKLAKQSIAANALCPILINDLKKLLVNYQNERAKKYAFKDAFTSADKKAREQSIADLQELFLTYETTGNNSELLAKINEYKTKFPGVGLSSVLNKITVKLMDANTVHTPSENTLAPVDILNVYKKTHAGYVEQITNLYDALAIMDKFAQTLANPNEREVITNLTNELQQDVNHFVNLHHDKLPTESAYLHFKAKFSARLHSEDSLMSKHEKLWKPIIKNILIALFTMGVLLGIQLAASKINTGTVRFFGVETEKQKMRSQVEAAAADLGIKRSCC